MRLPCRFVVTLCAVAILWCGVSKAQSVNESTNGVEQKVRPLEKACVSNLRTLNVAQITYWGGDERGNDFAGPRHDFPWCIPIATQTLHAAGAAMAFKVRREPRCALAYIGDGGTSEGAFYEAINLAGARALPVVFAIVNNGWAISVPVAAQTAAATLAQKAVAALSRPAPSGPNCFNVGAYPLASSPPQYVI